jgi:hypothetical protein
MISATRRSDSLHRISLPLTAAQIEACFLEAAYPGFYGQVKLVLPRIERRFSLPRRTVVAPADEIAHRRSKARDVLEGLANSSEFSSITAHYQDGRLLRLEVEDGH